MTRRSSLFAAILFICGSVCAQTKPIIPEYSAKPGGFQLIPLKGPPHTLTWHKQPQVGVIIWIHPVLYTIKDAEGVPIAERIKEFHTNLYPLCSVIFYEGTYDSASTRYHFADQGTCEYYSRSFANFENGQASSLFAVNTINNRDIWICDRNKAMFGSTKRSGLGLVRTIGHAWFFSKGWPEQGYKSPHTYLGKRFPADNYHLSQNASNQGYRNPHQSAPIYWPATGPGLDKYGRGGCDELERMWLPGWARSVGGGDGSAWLWKHDPKLGM